MFYTNAERNTEITMENTRINATIAAKVFLVFGLLKLSISSTSFIIHTEINLRALFNLHLATCDYYDIITYIS